MVAFLTRLMLVLRAWFKSRVSLEAENVVLRQQLLVLKRELAARRRERALKKTSLTRTIVRRSRRRTFRAPD